MNDIQYFYESMMSFIHRTSPSEKKNKTLILKKEVTLLHLKFIWNEYRFIQSFPDSQR